jgi:hypothetical protein
MRRLTLALVPWAISSACFDFDASKAYRVEVDLAGTEPRTKPLQLAWEVGDTARLVARIYYTNPVEVSEPKETVKSTSVERPDLYAWSTGDSTIAKLVVPGTVAMLSPGQTTLKVKTASATAEYAFTISPRR